MQLMAEADTNGMLLDSELESLESLSLLRCFDCNNNMDMGGSIAMVVPPNEWFIMEDPIKNIKMDDDWGYLHFGKPPWDYQLPSTGLGWPGDMVASSRDRPKKTLIVQGLAELLGFLLFGCFL